MIPSTVLEVVPWHHLDNHFGVLDSMEASLHWSDSGDIFHSYPCDKIDFEQIPILPRSYLQPSSKQYRAKLRQKIIVIVIPKEGFWYI